MEGLAIKDVAERTGIAAGTIRMWEQRYGFPQPQRTASGYRPYTEEDVRTLQRVVAYRARGLSVPAALERARRAGAPTDRPSIFGAVLAAEPAARPQRLHKASLIAISRAIEDETLARAAGPVVVAAFQCERHYRAVEHRYRRLARAADACVAFADFHAAGGGDGEPLRVPIAPDDALGDEWVLVVDAPGYAACLLAWETPESQRDRAGGDLARCFEALWTLDPRTVRRAAEVGAALAERRVPERGRRVQQLLEDRPLAMESPAPSLTALTNRIVAALDATR